MINRIAAEYSDKGFLLYSVDYVGAYTRGETLKSAIEKFPNEIAQYCNWRGLKYEGVCVNTVVQEKLTDLDVSDADSDIILNSETLSLTLEEYTTLRDLALKSAADFLHLYHSIPNKDGTVLAPRKTFYGERPITATQMYEHTKNVNSYYFAEIDIEAPNEPDIFHCRKAGFEAIEKTPDFLENAVFDGSYGEQWSLRKVLRRFIWHDRIHAKSMYKMACQLCGKENVANPFMF